VIIRPLLPPPDLAPAGDSLGNLGLQGRSKGRQVQVAVDAAELLAASTIPAAHQRGAMVPSCQRLTLAAWSRQIEIIDSMVLVLWRVRARRLQLRWDRDSGRWFAFVLVACAVVCCNRLHQPAVRPPPSAPVKVSSA
jgi:hypothetical protein